MQGTNIRKSSAGAHNGKRASRLSSIEKEAGIIFSGIVPFLLFSVKVIEDFLALRHFVNQGIERVYYIGWIHVLVIRHKRSNIGKPCIVVR